MAAEDAANLAAEAVQRVEHGVSLHPGQPEHRIDAAVDKRADDRLASADALHSPTQCRGASLRNGGGSARVAAKAAVVGRAARVCGIEKLW